MEIQSIILNNISIIKPFSAMKTSVAERWDIDHKLDFHLPANIHTTILFITVSIDRYSNNWFANVVVKTSFVLELKGFVKDKPSYHDLYKLAETIVVSKAHARWEFHRAIMEDDKNLHFIPHLAPYKSIEDELAEIDPSTFKFTPSQ